MSGFELLQPGDVALVVRDTATPQEHPCHGAFVGLIFAVDAIQANPLQPGRHLVYRHGAKFLCPVCHLEARFVFIDEVEKMRGPDAQAMSEQRAKNAGDSAA